LTEGKRRESTPRVRHSRELPEPSPAGIRSADVGIEHANCGRVLRRTPIADQHYANAGIARPAAARGNFDLTGLRPTLPEMAAKVKLSRAGRGTRRHLHHVVTRRARGLGASGRLGVETEPANDDGLRPVAFWKRSLNPMDVAKIIRRSSEVPAKNDWD
jgi:hypothetical protein